MTPTLSLADAITAAEQASQGYNGAAAQTATDQDVAAAAHNKADAADAVVAADKTNQATAASAYVSALQGLVAAAEAQISALSPASAGTTGS